MKSRPLEIPRWLALLNEATTMVLKELCHGIFIHFADVNRIIFLLKKTSQY